ncbi:hypothetical protein C0993_009995 [Termitomyces sp. T159_Od127]|nr:hypothetical protein C0993_009995 [Termitomyces sp. T159_Od127]
MDELSVPELRRQLLWVRPFNRNITIYRKTPHLYLPNLKPLLDVLLLMTELGTATESYRNTATKNLSSLKTSIEVISEHGAQEDKSIGQTPRKRTWEYVDEWELTKPRDTILQVRRGQKISAASSETFLAEPPLTEGGVQENEKIVELTPDVEVENVPPPPPPPPLVMPVVPLPVTKPASKLGYRRAPSIDTLTDARNVYITRASRRAR